VALPNPGMAFSPFDILTAEEMNNLVENIEALADGTGLNDNIVTSNKLNLGQSGVSGNVTTTTSTTYIAAGLSVTVNVGSSGMVLVGIGANLSNSGGNETRMAWSATGANTIVATNINAISTVGTNNTSLGRVWLLTGLSSGSTVFTLNKSVSGGTGSYGGQPNIFAVPF
jgi:hypothetical protein